MLFESECLNTSGLPSWTKVQSDFGFREINEFSYLDKRRTRFESLPLTDKSDPTPSRFGFSFENSPPVYLNLIRPTHPKTQFHFNQ
jgi:hypothetical protein